jgi:Ca-activated chloride channel family protein
VVARLPLDQLREIAAAGRGLFRQVSADGSDLAVLLPMFERRVEFGDWPEASSIALEQWVEAGVWLLIPLLPLAALAFRRGLIAGWLLVALLPLPRPAAAFDWQDLWQTRDQRAQRAFDGKDYPRAAETFEDPAWKAAAQYRAGQADQAAETLAPRQSADDQYNRGNALAQTKQYQAAIEAYDRALAQDPGNEDARYNKELVEQELRKQRQQSGQGKDRNKNPQSGEDSQQSQDGDQGQQDQGSQGDQTKSQQPSGEPGQQDRPEQARQDAQNQTGSGKDDQDFRTQAERDRGEQSEPKPQQAGEPQDAKQAAAQDAQASHGLSEDRQAAEQWLRRIPDDPGGLLKRKFLYQYQQRQGRRQP